jgi:hypothetical protein
MANIMHVPSVETLIDSYPPNSSAQGVDISFREEDDHFDLLQALARGEDSCGSDDTSSEVLASPRAPEHSAPILLSEEDLIVGHFHRDRCTRADFRTSLGWSPSVDRLFMLTGQHQREFDGFSSADSDYAVQVRDLANI